MKRVINSETRYESKTTITELNVVRNMLNVKIGHNSGMRDYVLSLETQFCKLVSMGSPVSDSVKITLLLTSLSRLVEYRPVIDSVNTMQKDVAT